MTKKTQDPNVDAAELAAWEQWKAICSILGCSSPHRDLLVRIVGAKFAEMVSKLSGGRVKAAESHSALEDWAHEFDVGLIERDDDAQKGGKMKVKHYKDWIWQRIMDGGNPPLECIRGLLFGQNGPLPRTVTRWMRRNYTVKTVKIDGGWRFRFSDSLDQSPTEGERGQSSPLVDRLPARSYSCPSVYERNDDGQEVADWLGEMSFTYAEAVVLLACQVALSVDSDEVKEALHLKKSTIGERQRKALARIRQSFAETARGRLVDQIARQCPIAFREQLVAWLLELTRSEPSAAAFVAVVEKCLR